MKRKWWHNLVSPASLAFFKEGRELPGYSLLDWAHGYFYGRFPYLYIGFGTGSHPLARLLRPLISRLFPPRMSLKPARKSAQIEKTNTFADGYHGKVVPLEAAGRLISVKEDIHLPDLEKIIPYTTARDLILKNPGSIAVIDCPCRASLPDPCLPLDVCLVIGEPFASFVLQHLGDRSRSITREEALEILKAEDERGHVHHAFFKDAMLNRFYAICNCCACCCGAMRAQRNGVPMLASSGYLAKVDEDLCTTCGNCDDSCQFGALSNDGFTSKVDQELCMGCGICIELCPQGALSLVIAPHKGEPLEITELTRHIFNRSGD